MLMFILRRLASGVVLVAVISFLAFVLLYLGGGDIARRILGENATAATVAQKTESVGENPHSMKITIEISERKWNQ